MLRVNRISSNHASRIKSAFNSTKRHQSSSKLPKKSKSKVNDSGDRSIQTPEILANMGLVFCGISYLNDDMTYLRLTALTGFSLSMLSQYQLKQMHTSLFRWNATFIGINMVWLILHKFPNLLKDDSLPDELEKVSEIMKSRSDVFGRERLKKLFQVGKREIKEQGDVLLSEGYDSKQMFFVESGSGIVARNGIMLGRVEEGDFIGCVQLDGIQDSKETSSQSNTELSQSIQSKKVEEEVFEDGSTTISLNETSMNGENESLFPEDESDESKSNETVVVESDEMIVWSFDFHDLSQCLDDELKVPLKAYLFSTMQKQLHEAWEMKIQDDQEKARLQQIAINYLFDGVAPDKPANT